MAVGSKAVTYDSVVGLCGRLHGRCCMLHHFVYLLMQQSAQALMHLVVNAAGWEACMSGLDHSWFVSPLCE